MAINVTTSKQYQGLIEVAGNPQNSTELTGIAVQEVATGSAIPADLNGVAKKGLGLFVGDGTHINRITPIGNKLLVIGDSITALNVEPSSTSMYSTSWLHYADMYSGGIFDISGILGFGGKLPDEIAVSIAPHLATGQFDYAVVLAGTNTNFAFDYVGRLAELETLWKAIEAAGVKIIAGTIPIDSSSTYRKNAVNYQVNSYIRAQADSGRLHLWEIANNVVDTTSTAWRSGFSTDGKHPAGPAYPTMGKALSETMKTTPAASIPRSIKSRNILDPNLITHNPNFYGNNAAFANGFWPQNGITGNGPHAWQVKSTSTSLVTASIAMMASTNSLEEALELTATVAYGGNDHQFEIYNLCNVATNWAANTAKDLGNFVLPNVPNGRIYKKVSLTTANTSATEPTWVTEVGDTQTDANGNIWMCMPVFVEGMIIQLSADFKINSLSGGGVTPCIFFGHDSISNTSNGRPTILNAGIETISAGAAFQSPNRINGDPGRTDWTLGEYVTIKSQKFVIRFGTNKDIAYIKQGFRMFGMNGVNVNFSIKNFEMRVVGNV